MDGMIERTLPIGAEIKDGGVHFRVWAPKATSVEVEFIGNGYYELAPEGSGYFSGYVPRIAAGALYKYRLEGKESFPDPASRFQPEGPYGPSEIIDPSSFKWTDALWPGIRLKGQVIYEMHVGTFTKEGTWRAAKEDLNRLSELGITLIELMPIAEFPGRFGWGYDGVDLFAPTHLYDRPDDLKGFIDHAHSIGMGVMLDVVYNHTGPEACFLSSYSDDYFTDKYANEWGKAINFDGAGAVPVREFVLSNVEYWIREFHFDGLRLDATQRIFDSSTPNILSEITARARQAALNRHVLVIAENEPQDVKLLEPPEEGGFGLDALWNDDFHHSARVALTGRSEAYYSDYLGHPQEFISAVKWGYLYQGQWYTWQGQRRGSPSLDLNPRLFVVCIQNHDQIANSSRGQRIHLVTSPGKYRAATALLLLAPATPMLFQGQEFASNSPFQYFCDLGPGFIESVREGRKKFLAQFRSLALPEMQEIMPEPDIRAFEASKIERPDADNDVYVLHRDLLRIRREDPVIRAQTKMIDGAVLSDNAFALRFFGKREDRLLIVNLGADLLLEPWPEPLVAPRRGRVWKALWSSEEPVYGGNGRPAVEGPQNWRISAETAVLLASGEED